MKKRSLYLTSCLALLFAGQSLADGNITGQLDVRLTIGEGCSVSNGGSIGSYNQFGTLDFGMQTNLNSELKAQSTGIGGGGNITIICTPGTNYSIAVDSGLNAVAEQRRMRNQSDTLTDKYINYNLFQDNGYSVPWIAADPVPQDSSGEPKELIFYGQVPSTTTAPESGTYTDSVTVSIVW